MSNAEELVRLDDLVIAGDRELVPVGPEIAGYLVLEAAARVRDVGGGVVGQTELAIDLAGNVVLVAPPRRADEARAAMALRRLLGELLHVATSSTPALRACAKRKDAGGLVPLIRELEGALIPLNRSASRRGVARIAREALELIEAGELELDDVNDEDEVGDEASPSPPPVVRTAPRKAEARTRDAEPAERVSARQPEPIVPSLPPPVVAAKAVPELALEPAREIVPEPVREPTPREPTPPPMTALATDTASTRPTLFDDATPQTAPAQFAERGPTPTPLDALAAELDAAEGFDGGHDEPFEVVSQLPPPVAESAHEAPEAHREHGELGERVDDDSSRSFAVAYELPERLGHAPAPTTMRAADVEAAEQRREAAQTDVATDIDGTSVATFPLAALPARPDRVKALADSFQVSRLKDDPALSRELKAMIGVETGKPPTVIVDMPADLPRSLRGRRKSLADAATPAGTVSSLRAEHAEHAEHAAHAAHEARESRASRASRASGATNETSGDLDVQVDELEPETPARRPGFLRRTMASLGLVAMAGAAAFFGVKGSLARHAGATPPETVTTQATVSGAGAPAGPMGTNAGQLPATCEGTLTLEGIAEGSEVVRKLGTAPLTTTLPVRVPLDFVALAEGRPPQRAHLDASAAWIGDAAGPHLDLAIALDAASARSDAKWPARTPSTSPLGARSPQGARGLLRVKSNPEGASVWLAVDPHGLSVPCGAATDLLVIAPGGASRPLRVEWSAFTGMPARASVKAQ